MDRCLLHRILYVCIPHTVSCVISSACVFFLSSFIACLNLSSNRRPLWLAEWSIWLQTSQICSTLLPVAFPVFLHVCGETVSGHMVMPTAAVTASYASLTSSANGKAGLGRCGAPAWQLFGPACVCSEYTGPEAPTLLLSELRQPVKPAPIQIFM